VATKAWPSGHKSYKAHGQRLSTAALLFRCAKKMGLKPNWITPNGLFAVSADGQEKYVNFARSPLNSHTSVSLARNKYLTRLILGRHDMPNIPFVRPHTQTDAELFLRRHRKIVAKPTRGSGSRDIHIVTSAAQLKTLNITKYILEKYIAGSELRYLVLNDTVIGVDHSEYGTSVEVTRPSKHTSHPSTAWSPTLTPLSIQTARILGLKFAAIDYLVDPAGRAYILEVNTTPDLKWFHAPTSGPVVDVARHFLEAIFEDQRTKPGIPAGVPLEAQTIMAYS